MSKVEHLDQIVETFGPHLHDAPYDGWRTDRVIDRVVPTHCPYCAVQCGMNLLVEKDHVYVIRPGHTLTIKDGAHSPQRMLPESTLVAFLRALG